MLAFPDFNKPFEVETDASTLSIGAVLLQDQRLIEFFNQKLSDA